MSEPQSQHQEVADNVTTSHPNSADLLSAPKQVHPQTRGFARAYPLMFFLNLPPFLAASLSLSLSLSLSMCIYN